MTMTAEDFATSWRVGAHRPRNLQQKLRKMARDAMLDGMTMMVPPLGDTFLRPLFCHYVFDDQRAEFEAILRRLQGYGTFIDTPTCVGMVKGEIPIDGRYYHLSFDDGLHNLMTNAVPIMDALSVPSIIFANSALADASFDEQAEHSRTVTRYPAPVRHMDWNDLRAVRAAGVEIGAHTKRHPLLTEISGDAARLEDEIAGCKTDIERELGEPCPYFAWPYGKPSDIDDTAQAAVKAAGFEANFGMIRSPVIPGETDPFTIPRHHFEVQWPLRHIAYFARGGMENA